MLRRAVALFLLLGGLSLYGQSSLKISGSDDQSGTRQLFEWLRGRGLAVELTSTGSSIRHRNDFIFLMNLRLSENGLDRLIVSSYFAVEPSFQGKPEVELVLAEMNRMYNIATFCVDNDGDVQIRSQITFVDYIDEVEIREFLKWFDSSLMSIVMANKRLQDIIR